MKFNSIQRSLSNNAVKQIFLSFLLLFFIFIVGSYFLNVSSIIDGFHEGAGQTDIDTELADLKIKINFLKGKNKETKADGIKYDKIIDDNDKLTKDGYRAIHKNLENLANHSVIAKKNDKKKLINDFDNKIKDMIGKKYTSKTIIDFEDFKTKIKK